VFEAAPPDARPTLAGEPLTAAVQSALVRVIRDAPRVASRDGCPALTVVAADGRAAVIAWRAEWTRAGELSSLHGFIAGPELVVSLFQRVLREAPLLPPSLVPDGASPNAALTVRASAPEAPALFSSAGDWSPYAATEELAADLGRLRLAVALRPEAAGGLVIGGLPRERLPLVVALLAVTAGLVVVALVQLRRETEIARLRSDFVSGVSHELRTPLAQIRMFTETLLLGRVRTDLESRRALEIIARETERLTQLVENVLFFSSAERRRPTIAPQPVRLAPIAAEVVESFGPLAAARHTRIETRVDDGLAVSADAGAIRQILVNLLDNAVKYGPPGQTVTVGLDLAADPSRPERRIARLTVEDEGPGIADEDAARIWAPFSRLARAEAAATGGAGIGLAIVRQLVDLHGGAALVERAPSGGARFVIELPGAWRDDAVAPRAGAAGAVA
jgi:signal transduction histidine kinase